MNKFFLFCVSIGLLWSSVLLAHAPQDFTEAKKIARMIWSEHRETFYCGCRYDLQGYIDFTSCAYRPTDRRASKRINWEHVMPVSWYGKNRSCWQAKPRGGRVFCRQHDADFRVMESDLHNLVPAIPEINQKRRHYAYDEWLEVRPTGCQTAISPQRKRIEPRDEVKGMTARIMLYMSDKYQVVLAPSERRILTQWNKTFPPSAWEKRWHEKVLVLQGDNNPYIEDYHNYKNRG